MNKYCILICCLTSIISCNSQKQEVPKESDLPTIDLNANLEKQEINLQDIATVEYIPLESKLNNICTGLISHIDDSIIITSGGETFRGGFCDVLFFTRDGKFINNFNRQGDGPEEYRSLGFICYDKVKDELYVLDNFRKKFQIYNHKGDFIRSIKYPKEIDKEKHMYISYYKNFSPDKLLCCINSYIEYEDKTYDIKCDYALLSKKTGEYIRQLDINQEVYKTAHIVEYHDYTTYTLNIATYPIINTINGYNIFDTASDYVYHIDNDMNLKSILKKEYSDESSKMRTFLMGGIETPQYIFLKKITKKEKNSYRDMSIDDFEFEDIVFNKSDYSYTNYTIHDKNWISKELDLTSQKAYSFGNLPNTAVTSYSAAGLKEAYNENKLEGELKDIAAKIGEEDNPVLVVMAFKQ